MVIPAWWFRTFFIFPYIGNNHPKKLIFFRGVATTNQILYIYIYIYTVSMYLHVGTYLHRWWQVCTCNYSDCSSCNCNFNCMDVYSHMSDSISLVVVSRWYHTLLFFTWSIPELHHGPRLLATLHELIKCLTVIAAWSMYFTCIYIYFYTYIYVYMYVQITYQIKCCFFFFFFFMNSVSKLCISSWGQSWDSTAEADPNRPVPVGTWWNWRPGAPGGRWLNGRFSSTHWCLTIKKGLPFTINTLRWNSLKRCGFESPNWESKKQKWQPYQHWWGFVSNKKGSPVVLFPVKLAGTIQLELAMRIYEKGSKFMVHLPDCGFHPQILLAMSSF